MGNFILEALLRLLLLEVFGGGVAGLFFCLGGVFDGWLFLGACIFGYRLDWRRLLGNRCGWFGLFGDGFLFAGRLLHCCGGLGLILLGLFGLHGDRNGRVALL